MQRRSVYAFSGMMIRGCVIPRQIVKVKNEPNETPTTLTELTEVMSNRSILGFCQFCQCIREAAPAQNAPACRQ